MSPSEDSDKGPVDDLEPPEDRLDVTGDEPGGEKREWVEKVERAGDGRKRFFFRRRR